MSPFVRSRQNAPEQSKAQHQRDESCAAGTKHAHEFARRTFSVSRVGKMIERQPGRLGRAPPRRVPARRVELRRASWTERRTDAARKLMPVGDEHTRECLAVEVARSLTARDVIATLGRLFKEHGAPRFIRSDDGPEFIARRKGVARRERRFHALHRTR